MGLEPIVPEGTYLANSRDTAGNKRALLFEIGTGKLVGPPELEERWDSYSDSDEPEDQPAESNGPTTEDVLAAVEILVGLGVLVAPHLRRFWQDKISPALKARAAVREKRALQREAQPDHDSTETSDPVLTGAQVRRWIEMIDLAIDSSADRSGSANTQLLCAGVLVGAARLAHQMRLRSDGAGLNRSDSQDLARAFERLATVEYTQNLNRMLESQGFLLDEQELAAIDQLFDGGRVRGERYVPLQTQRVVQALVLPAIGQ